MESASYFISPNFHPAMEGANTAKVINPSTLEQVGERLICGDQEISEALTAANAAQKEWARLDTKTRAGFLHKIADRIESADPEPVSVLLTKEMGKPYPESVGEIANCGGIFRYYAEMARDEGGKVAGTTQTDSLQFARYHPYGVSVHILPFNFPMLLMCWSVAASLAAGNACIIKPAEATTLSTLKFMAHFDHLPKGLVSCLPGDATTATKLIESKHTHAVAFTGSVAAGKQVATACAQQLKPAIIEAGGSDPMIISANAPMEVAVGGAVTAAFHLSGQICTSAERFLVVDSVHDEFVEKFNQATQKLRIGDGLGQSEIGPLVSEAARNKVNDLITNAINDGATLVCGGNVPNDCGPGWFYTPTILTNVNQEMEIVQSECFGPVAAIMRVPDFNAAIDAANQSSFGLGASVFTTDLEESIEAADRLEAGMVWVNNPLIDNDALPFGGWKMSGIGRELGRQGLDTFRRSKMVIIDHKPKIHDWWYPYENHWFHSGGGRGLGE